MKQLVITTIIVTVFLPLWGKGEASFSDSSKRLIVMADQSVNRVAIADVDSRSIVWEWVPTASNVRREDAKWFTNISDVKPVYDNKYVLTTASAGGIALIRIADKKTVFYAYCGNGNIHSAEVLPDGNIVIAASTGGYLMLLKTDTTVYPFSGYTKKYNQPDAHNVVWDKKRQILWSASGNKLYQYEYNFNSSAPDLILKDSMELPASGCHDLFPVGGSDALWLSTSSKVWMINLQNKTVNLLSALPGIKSVSSGSGDNYPAMMIQALDGGKHWYNDKVIDFSGRTVFQLAGLKMYKARWLVANNFSY